MLDCFLFSEEKKTLAHLPAFIHSWYIENIRHIPITVLDKLVKGFRAHGLKDFFPQCCQTLVQSLRGKVPSREMQGLKGRMGTFTYMGIQKELSKRISLDIYKEDEIKVVIFVDGAPIDDGTQTWPILMMIFNKKYRTRPFAVAIYTGKTKPKSSADFFHEFVEEAIVLTLNGIVISKKKFKFELVACICDTLGKSRSIFKTNM